MATYGRYDTITAYITEREGEAAEAGRRIASGVGDAAHHMAIIGWCRDRITTARQANIGGRIIESRP